MNVILNLLWLFLGGFSAAVAWLIAGFIMLLTIIGIPWAKATFQIGMLTLWPFGSESVARKTTSGEDIGTGVLGLIGNIIWFVLVGWWLFLYHMAWALLLFLTIIGIPFGLQHWKLAKLSVAPIGKDLVWK